MRWNILPKGVRVGLLAGLLAMLPAAPALAKVHTTELENGMTVLVETDRRAPTVVSQVWYGVGSSYEPGGITGVSHILEHMMFKGTEEVGPGEFSRIIKRLGGRENAFTGRDYTAYFEQLAADQLDRALELEADRMVNLRLDPEEFASERDVVMEERRLRTEDQPAARLREAFNATAWMASPYGQPIIGWMDDLANMELNDLQGWYERFYTPANATLVVVGDVEPGAVFAAARRHFGDLEGGEAPTIKPRREPDQTGPREVVVRVPARVPQVRAGYKVPALNTAAERDDAYALEVAAGLLAGGDSARLPRRLVREREIAASASAGYGLYDRMDTLFTLTGTPSENTEPRDLVAALREEARALAEGEIEADELERVKAQVVASEVYQRDSQFYKAMRRGLTETVGLGWEVVDEYADRVEAVTAEDVRRVAEEYFREDRLTVAILEPEGSGPAPQQQPSTGGMTHGN
ncbi:zinc protease [Thiohalospira halophila DSM 15071]|uniref:Zinc protease n=1 Tax=Thiohalospira halophila DSM 15071 TaxID=1123397 RepID=A0A1I1SMT0_9GAMM|nr:pitrilysin family protein [Thiohalospira halophila]SFD47701.1 zinc protease [Thiohalospira halophila DSM 15071]